VRPGMTPTVTCNGKLGVGWDQNHKTKGVGSDWDEIGDGRAAYLTSAAMPREYGYQWRTLGGG